MNSLTKRVSAACLAVLMAGMICTGNIGVTARAEEASVSAVAVSDNSDKIQLEDGTYYVPISTWREPSKKTPQIITGNCIYPIVQ